MAPLWRKCLAEAVGTGFIVLFGTGSVACQISFGAHEGLFQIAMIWGLGVSLAIFSTAAVSGAHLNPAVSLAFALLRPKDFPRRELAPFVGAQFVGGVFGSALVLAVFNGTLERADEIAGFERGAFINGNWSSVGSAAAFGEYFVNPGTGVPPSYVSPAGAFAIEALGTAILMFMILALTDERNAARPPPGLAPFFIGLTVAVLISLFAPLTMAGWNPARDFSPRIIAVLAGYGSVALPGPRHGFWVYIVGPCLGAPIGGLAYDVLIQPHLPEAPEKATPDGGSLPGMWCSDRLAFESLVRDACSTVCKPKQVDQCPLVGVYGRPEADEPWDEMFD